MLSSYFFRYLPVSENISCYYDNLLAPIRLVCLCATLIFFKQKIQRFCTDLFRGYSQLPAKPKFNQINCNHTIKNFKNT